MNTKIFSPFYQAPEYLTESRMDTKSDIWALGCIVHEMCTLKETFSEEGKDSIQAIANRIIAAKPPPINDQLFSKGLTQLIGKMLQKDPKLRPSVRQIKMTPYVQAVYLEQTGEVPVYSSSTLDLQANKNQDSLPEKEDDRDRPG